MGNIVCLFHPQFIAYDSTILASQTVTKIIQVNGIMVATMAGSAADCQYWSRVIGAESQFESLHSFINLTIRLRISIKFFDLSLPFYIQAIRITK